MRPAQQFWDNKLEILDYSLSAEIAAHWFVGPFDLISIIYANIQNPMCNVVAPYHLYEVSST